MSSFLKMIEKMGSSAIQLLSSEEAVETIKPHQVMPSGIFAIDVASGIGGVPKNRIIELYGNESCLDKDTIIKFSSWTKDGKYINRKGGTIQSLYNQFRRKGKFKKDSPKYNKTRDAYFTVPCINEEGFVFHNIVEDVFYNGIRPIYEVKTQKGLRIKATKNHRFMMRDGSFKRLHELNEGDQILIHNETRFSKKQKPAIYRKEVYVKHHPVWPTRLIEGKYLYHRTSVARCTYEAFLNGLSLNEYITKLNSGDIQNVCVLDPQMHIHHLDENPCNNDISNLCPISPSRHGQLHIQDRLKNLSFVAVSDEIVSVTECGYEKVYDLRVQSPFHNYVANGFVVHNSGKTTAALHVCAQFNKAGLYAAFIDMEHAFDYTYAKKLGIVPSLFTLSQPMNAEEAGKQMLDLAGTDDCGVVVLDSIAAMITERELEGDLTDANIGATAALMGRLIRKMVPTCSVHETLGLFINQNRDNVGGAAFAPASRQPGGRAIKFFASMRIEFSRISTNKTSNEATSNTTKAKFVKNKLATPYKEAHFDIEFGKGADNEKTIIEQGVKQGIIEQKGRTFTYKEGILGTNIKDAVKTLKANKELCAECRRLVLEALAPKKKDKTKEPKPKATGKAAKISVTENDGGGQPSVRSVLRD